MNQTRSFQFWVFDKIEFWDMSDKFEWWVLSYEFWVLRKPQTKYALASIYKDRNPYLSTMIQHLNNLQMTLYGDRLSFD